ncbi:outer membrane beta-barrel protein [Chitinimonas taiwanensis]|uniref:outer membrane beta-barrel protein n=1 Tax=Chitinimonas taiwanensis TaxID=240412 RepID=UPI0035B2C72C
MNKLFSALALAAALSAPALANDLYIGADIGRSDIEVDAGNGFTVSKDSTSFAVFGGVQFHKNFAAELAYRDLGELKSGNAKLSAYALQASLLGSLPVSNEFSLLGRVGLASINAEYRESGFGYSYSEDSSETKPFFGVGARYAVNKQLGIRAEYNQYAEIEDTTISTMTVGVDYRF